MFWRRQSPNVTGLLERSSAKRLVALDPLFAAEPSKAVECSLCSAYDAKSKSFETLLSRADLDEEFDEESAAERIAIRTAKFVELQPEQLALIAAVLRPCAQQMTNCTATRKISRGIGVHPGGITEW